MAEEELQATMKSLEEVKGQAHLKRRRAEIIELRLKEVEDNLKSNIALAWKEGDMKISHLQSWVTED